MKRYLLFAGDHYYPRGGWEDFVTSHDDMEALRRHPKCGGSDWFHIVDTQTGQMYSPAWDAETLVSIEVG